MLAVDGQFAGRGIGQELIRRCIENGYRKGYQKALTEATGKISQHIFRKNGFMQRFSVPYGSFLYENRPVFASIQGHEGAMLMDKSIKPCSAIGSGATAYQ
jgi:GNAT superfamily N-acetyltransferase